MADGQLNPSYFDTAYRDYYRQNPVHKLDHYLAQVSATVSTRAVRLLDVGCGLGSFLRHVSSQKPDWEMFATDVDPVAVSAVKDMVSHVSAMVASAEEEAFPEESFDVITAWDVLEHVSDLESAGKEMSRMLRPGGRLFFVVPVYDGPAGLMVRLLDKDPTHIQRRPRSDWLAWASRHFQLEDWHGLFRYLFGRRYLHLASRRWRSWSPAILVSCSKGEGSD